MTNLSDVDIKLYTERICLRACLPLAVTLLREYNVGITEFRVAVYLIPLCNCHYETIGGENVVIWSAETGLLSVCPKVCSGPLIQLKREVLTRVMGRNKIPSTAHSLPSGCETGALKPSVRDGESLREPGGERHTKHGIYFGEKDHPGPEHLISMLGGITAAALVVDCTVSHLGSVGCSRDPLRSPDSLQLLECYHGPNSIARSIPVKLSIEVNMAPLSRLVPVIVQPARLVVLYDDINRSFRAPHHDIETHRPDGRFHTDQSLSYHRSRIHRTVHILPRRN